MHHNVPHAAPKETTITKGSLAWCSISFYFCTRGFENIWIQWFTAWL